MTLADPRPSLAEHSSLIGYLMGVAALTQAIDILAVGSARRSPSPADDFVHLLVGIASLGRAIEHLAGPVTGAGEPKPTPPQRWLR